MPDGFTHHGKITATQLVNLQAAMSPIINLLCLKTEIHLIYLSWGECCQPLNALTKQSYNAFF
jgi:hypothetical protein